MEGMELSELELLEKQIESLAQEINLDERHVQKFFDGTYTSISLTKHSKARKVILLTQLSNDGNSPIINPIIKTVKADNQELINKMKRFVELVRLYRLMKKAKEIKERVKEKATVSLVS